MDKPRFIKTITPVPCPSCGHNIHVCFSFLPPGLTWIITDEEMLANKTKLKELLQTIVFKSKDEEKETMEWIDSPDCVLGAEDIEEVAKSIIKEQKE